MKVLLLYGVNCTKKVWRTLIPYLDQYDTEYVEYPHEVTQKSQSVGDITQWVYETYGEQEYDIMIGHSMGGIIALQLAAEYKMRVKQIVYLDTNLRPAKEFYRNLMTPENMEQFGTEVMEMFQEERKYYTKELFDALQNEFDYTEYVRKIEQDIYAVYGDRNQPDYSKRVEDLNLPESVVQKLQIQFVPNACHMIMLENPEYFSGILTDVIEKKQIERQH